MALYASRKQMYAAVWREDVCPWLWARLNVFITAFIWSLGALMGLIIAAWVFRWVS